MEEKENYEYPESYEKQISPPEQFLGKARELSGSIIVTIDKKVVDYLGIEIGDQLRLWVKKV